MCHWLPPVDYGPRRCKYGVSSARTAIAQPINRLAFAGRAFLKYGIWRDGPARRDSGEPMIIFAAIVFWANAMRAWSREALSILAALALAFILPAAAHAAEEAKAASGPPFKIALFVSSRNDQCYDAGEIAAIKTLTQKELHRINAEAGVSGRPVEVQILDDVRDDQKAVGNMRAALAEPQMLAMIGLSNSTRGKAVFDALGKDIGASSIPFLSDISVNTMFAPYPNVYSTRASQDADSIPVIVQFTRHFQYQRPVFVGLRDSVGVSALAKGLKEKLGESGLAGELRVPAENDKVAPADIAAIVAFLKEKQPDLVYLYVGGSNVTSVIKELNAAGVAPALFAGGRIEQLAPEVVNTYQNAIYSLAWDKPPEVFNDRMRTAIAPGQEASWVFEGKKVDAAPGWAKGECAPRSKTDEPDPFSIANQRAIAIGSQYADMVALVAAAARTEDRTLDIAKLRAQVLKSLQSQYAAGHGAFKGSFDNWSFVTSTRAAARNPFVIILPQGLGRTQLAQIQFVRSRDGSLRQMETLYADIDLIKAHRVNDNEKSFFAEFYLAMRDSPVASIDRIEFSNAYLDAEAGGGRQITVETLHPGGPSPAYPESMKIFKVSGRFLFQPDLSNYPFDIQRFSIDLQPKTGSAPFIVQPPPYALRDKQVISDGWQQKAQYVGYDEDFVPVVDAFTHEPSVVPFYKARFAWVMQRQATDYFLRVAVPLAFILFVAYLSIFIPRSHFEAIVTIQVTALLSCVALYLSLPKLNSDSATFSDRAFVFAYMILSVIIGISIMRINPSIGGRTGTERTLAILHITAIPIFAAVALYYISTLDPAFR
jgi:ABC-type branched-subunit amino acid transport system substrate-binding protein